MSHAHEAEEIAEMVLLRGAKVLGLPQPQPPVRRVTVRAGDSRAGPPPGVTLSIRDLLTHAATSRHGVSRKVLQAAN
jgi:hypothetical protein